MRKLAVMLMSVLIIFLFGCEPKTPPEPVLDFEASMYVDGTEYTEGVFSIEADITSTQMGVAVISVTTPDELRGLQYKWGEGFEIIYKGLHCQTEKGYLPKESFAEAVYGVLTSMAREYSCESFKDGVAVFRGESPSGEYTATADSDGYIQNISVEEINLSVDFKYQQ